MVCELEGPMPILKSSSTLMNIGYLLSYTGPVARDENNPVRPEMPAAPNP
jgi:hypothetical protein